MVDAKAVDAQIEHLLEIEADLLWIRQRLAVLAGFEGAVGDALHIEFVSSEAEEFAVASDAIGDGLDDAMAAALGTAGFRGCGRLNGRGRTRKDFHSWWPDKFRAFSPPPSYQIRPFPAYSRSVSAVGLCKSCRRQRI